MINRLCDLCNQSVIDTWTYQISDTKDKITVTGHKMCIDEFEASFKRIKNYSSKSVSQCTKELNYTKE
jgi:hypothetical protein